MANTSCWKSQRAVASWSRPFCCTRARSEPSARKTDKNLRCGFRLQSRRPSTCTTGGTERTAHCSQSMLCPGLSLWLRLHQESLQHIHRGHASRTPLVALSCGVLTGSQGDKPLPSLQLLVSNNRPTLKAGHHYSSTCFQAVADASA